MLVNSRHLRVFRTLAFLLIAVELSRYFGARGEVQFVSPELLFSAFPWLPRPNRALAHFLAPCMTALLAIAGLNRMVRPALIGFCLVYGYTLCLTLSDYNNHHYLYWLVASYFALIGPLREKVPSWTYALFKFQLLLVFLFAALAKLNLEWLQGLPLQSMMEQRGIENRELILLASWSGLLIDLVVAPCLLWARTRWPAVFILGAFHLSNSFLFDIDTFPYFMLATLPLFFAPQAGESSQPPRGRLRTLLLALVVLQLFIPLRHHLIPGDVNWDRGGHRLAWRMMLNRSLGTTRYTVQRAAGVTETVDFPYRGLNRAQIVAISFCPDLMWRYGQWLGRQPGVQRVWLECDLSWNGREKTPLFAPATQVSDERTYRDHLLPSPRDSEPWYLVLLQLTLLGLWLGTVGLKLLKEALGESPHSSKQTP